MRGRDKFAKYRNIIQFITIIWKAFPRKSRQKLFEYFRYHNGNYGLVMRYTLLKSIAKHVGDNVAIFPGSFILNPQELVLGSNISIQPMCYIDATGGVVIEDSVSIAHSSTIMSSDHSFDCGVVPIKEQPLKLGRVVIEHDTWIASHCSILQGCHIPYGTVIAAGAIVTKSLVMTPECVWGGVPAKFIKHR